MVIPNGKLFPGLGAKAGLDPKDNPSAISLTFDPKFITDTGMPPLDYFIHINMQLACKLLLLPMKRSGKCGGGEFDDLYYFSRVFKKQIGSSPEQFRLKVKKRFEH